MAARKKQSDDIEPEPRPPATSREAVQAEMENLTIDLVRKRLINGDATSAETVHFLRSASTRGRIEELRLKQEIELMKAKQSQVESMEKLQEMFQAAEQAMTSYRIERPEDNYVADL